LRIIPIIAAIMALKRTSLKEPVLMKKMINRARIIPERTPVMKLELDWFNVDLEMIDPQ
jgi:hypothetical protein